MADTELQQLAKTDRNPVQETRYQELLRQNGGQVNPTNLISSSGLTGGLNTTDILANAQKMQDFYKKQNEPAIASYQSSKDPLKQRYSDLLASIKGNQQTAENRQTVTTQNELGRRGLSPDSGIAQQEMTSALNPITQQYTQLQKDITNQQNIDLASIDRAIAQLRAGNPEASISSATGIANAIQAANQFEQTLKETQKQNEIKNEIEKLQAKQKTGYQVMGEGSSIYDPITGKIIATAPKSYKATLLQDDNPLGL
jgi:hypothetical protein